MPFEVHVCNEPQQTHFWPKNFLFPHWLQPVSDRSSFSEPTIKLGWVFSTKTWCAWKRMLWPHGEAQWKQVDRESPPGKALQRGSAPATFPTETVLFPWLILSPRYWLPHCSPPFPFSHCQVTAVTGINALSIQMPGHLCRTFCYWSIKVLRNAKFQTRIGVYGEANTSGSLLGIMRSEFLDKRHWQVEKLGMKLRSWETVII